MTDNSNINIYALITITCIWYYFTAYMLCLLYFCVFCKANYHTYRVTNKNNLSAKILCFGNCSRFFSDFCLQRRLQAT